MSHRDSGGGDVVVELGRVDAFENIEGAGVDEVEDMDSTQDQQLLKNDNRGCREKAGPKAQWPQPRNLDTTIPRC